jgi:hypothetical protein
MFDIAPTGGFKVIFEIANRLQERGHEVSITTIGNENNLKYFKTDFSTSIYKRPRFTKVIDLIIKKYLHENISLYLDIKYLSKTTPECDINVATHCFTAFSVFRSEKGTPFYHMQHYEPLFFNNVYLKKISEETYYLPINKIVNSIWLQKQIKDKFGISPPIINPSIDHDISA